MRTGILSDDHINLHCAKYRPVPMNMTDTILSHEMTRLKLGTSYNGKKLKYPMPIYRPLTFDHFARAATRLSGDPNFRETIHNMYAAQTGTGSTLMTVPPTGGAPASSSSSSSSSSSCSCSCSCSCSSSSCSCSSSSSSSSSSCSCSCSSSSSSSCS